MKPSPIKLPKHIHIIGICGVATSALAIAFHQKGVRVTGSDKGFFPPVSTELEKHGIAFYAGWHPEKMVEGGIPDLVIAGASGTSLSNPEIIYVKEHRLPLLSFAEALGRFVIHKNSIVVCGTWGKTTSSALLSSILLNAEMDPSHFSGGVSLSEPAAAITDSDWSVVEGDEYQAAIWDKKAKFFYYKPTHLLLTAVSWDHADLYPTEADYFDAFKKLVMEMPSSGLIVANKDNAGVAKILKSSSKKIVSYGKESADYTYGDVLQSKDGLAFTIHHKDESFLIQSPMIGAFQAENLTGCFAMAREMGIEPEKIISAIASFKGMKRRLEKRLDGDAVKSGVTIFDDIAHSPEKASAVLKELRSIYDGKIIAIFEPNIGGRERDASAKYDNAFKDADMVIIPRLTKLKVGNEKEASGKEAEEPMEGDELTMTIGKTHTQVRYIEDDNNLVDFLRSNTKKGDVIVFLGSHSFRGMIEETVKKLGM
jgi:UDP-N-acetylmuramate: L-alanyl-gamma-D-glutamyl-meso-diaminopimelate ligase